MVAFTDLLALMLTFFVLMFSMSTVKHDAWDALVTALTRQLNTVQQWRDPRLESERTVPRVDEARAFDLDYLAGVLEDKFNRNSEGSPVVVSRLDDRLVVSLSGDYIFGSGTADLETAGVQAAQAITGALSVIANRVDVVGHTGVSADPESGEYASAWDLSLARAVVFANAMTAAGYPFRINAYGLAASRYFEIAPDASDETRARMARRIDLVIRDAKASEVADAS
jgi:chemotaxis protein MotB